jgi:hypothetical protein
MEVRERFSQLSVANGEITGADKTAPAAFLQCHPAPERGVYKLTVYGGNFSMKSLRIYLFTA